MSGAFGHEIHAIAAKTADSTKAFYQVHTQVKRIEHWNKPGVIIWDPGCTNRKCDEMPVYVTRYSYVTGRRGRVTDRIQYCCKVHGEVFAKKHSLDLPALPENGPTETKSEGCL